MQQRIGEIVGVKTKYGYCHQNMNKMDIVDLFPEWLHFINMQWGF